MTTRSPGSASDPRVIATIRVGLRNARVELLEWPDTAALAVQLHRESRERRALFFTLVGRSAALREWHAALGQAIELVERIEGERAEDDENGVRK
jgi:hypothetical protein